MSNEALVNKYDERYKKGQHGAARAGYWKNFLNFLDEYLTPLLKTHGNDLNVLDVGCGNGDLADHLIKCGTQVTGIDFSGEAIRQCNERFNSGKFFEHDLSEDMPFEESTFDLIWCSEVLEHLYAPRKALEETHRVLKPEGVLLVTVPYHGMLKNVGIALLAFESHYDPEHPHIRFYTKKSLSALAEKSGFEVVRVTQCGSDFGLRDVFVPTNILLTLKRSS